MQFDSGEIYHIYNRGNNRQTIFFHAKNYLFFLDKVRKHIYPYCNILAWCLRPNHFHFLVQTNEKSIVVIKEKPIPITRIVEELRLLLSSYSKAINIQENRIGNLFQQKTKSKLIACNQGNYALTAFHYIHQNPMKARLVTRMEEWEFSSFKDYAGLRNGKLCNKDLAIQLLDLNMNTFVQDSYNLLADDSVKEIF